MLNGDRQQCEIELWFPRSINCSLIYLLTYLLITWNSIAGYGMGLSNGWIGSGFTGYFIKNYFEITVEAHWLIYIIYIFLLPCAPTMAAKQRIVSGGVCVSVCVCDPLNNWKTDEQKSMILLEMIRFWWHLTFTFDLESYFGNFEFRGLKLTATHTVSVLRNTV